MSPVCGFVVWPMVNVLTQPVLSLSTFSVSRIPFREDPPPDIIPPPWADRSVVHKSFLAANAGDQYVKCHKYSFSCQLAGVRKSFVEMGAFYNGLNCNSSLTSVGNPIRVAQPVAMKGFMNGVCILRRSFCTFPKSEQISFSVAVSDYDPAAFVTLPPGGECELYSHLAFWYLATCHSLSFIWRGFGIISKLIREENPKSCSCVWFSSVLLSHSPNCIWTNGGSCSSCSS